MLHCVCLCPVDKLASNLFSAIARPSIVSRSKWFLTHDSCSPTLWLFQGARHRRRLVQEHDVRSRPDRSSSCGDAALPPCAAHQASSAKAKRLFWPPLRNLRLRRPQTLGSHRMRCKAKASPAGGQGRRAGRNGQGIFVPVPVSCQERVRALQNVASSMVTSLVPS